MLPTETSKRRSARIGLEHFRSVDRLALVRAGLCLVASVVSIAWLGGFGLDVREWSSRATRAESLATHGPLTNAHARLEVSCNACHVPFEAMDSGGWLARVASNPRSSDARCSTCHQTVGGHQSTAKDEDIASCASCHRDHQGREVSLLSMPDRDCTRCHSETDRHMKPEARPTFARSVTKFDAEPSDHPEFSLFRDGTARDPGHLKFNHALHMARGFNLEPGGRPIKRIGDLLESDREKYRGAGQRDLDPVQLDCDSCHQGEADRRARPTRDRTAGAYMRPIRFEQDCRACHPLEFDPELPAIRHGLQPDSMSESLWQSYSAKRLRERSGVGITPRPVPGWEDRPEARAAISEDVARAERILSGEKRCGECHSFEESNGRPTSWLSANARIRRSGIPDQWFRQATFDHSKHRTARCVDCHARAFAETPNASRSADDVLIPAIAVCLSCHSPKAPASNRAANGCVDCHRYHNGSGAGNDVGLASRREHSGSRSGPSELEVVRWIMAGEADRARSNRGLTNKVPGGVKP